MAKTYTMLRSKKQGHYKSGDTKLEKINKNGKKWIPNKCCFQNCISNMFLNTFEANHNFQEMLTIGIGINNTIDRIFYKILYSRLSRLSFSKKTFKTIC